MADLRKLKDQAAELASRGKVEKAAELFREVLSADPGDVVSCQKLAEVLRRGGEIAEAVGRYAEVAERFARDGLLIKAIAISKTILELDPAHVRTQRLLADLYARRAVTGATRPPPTATLAMPSASSSPLPADRRAIELPAVPEGELEPARGVSRSLGLQAPAGELTAFGSILEAADLAVRSGVDDGIHVEIAQAGDEGHPDARLPRVPLFSDLGAEAFVALTEGLSVARLAADETVLTEGDEGTDLYVVVTGRLRVTRRDETGIPVVLAHLGEGDFFGERALLSGAPRSATVVAEEPSELLVIRAEVLRSLAGRHPHLAASLRRFCRQRLLASALAVSPLFRPLGPRDRKAVMERFRERVALPGQVVIREGTPADGLYVVLEGVLDVAVRGVGTDRLVGQLREGDLFGETSCLRKAGATATVTVKRGGSLLRLPRSDLDALLMTYPLVLEALSRLSADRAESRAAILSGSAAYAEDGLVLI